MATSVRARAIPTVLVVDDEPDIRDVVRAILEVGGLQVIDEARDGPDALDRFRELDPPPVPSVVLLDNRMPGLTGLAVAERMLLHHPDQVIVLFSAHLDQHVEAAAARIGVSACVSKMDLATLPDTIRDLLPAD